MAIYFKTSNLFAVIRPGSVIDESVIHVLYTRGYHPGLSLCIMVLHTEMGAGLYIIKLHKHVEH